MYSKENEMEILERIADPDKSGGCFCYFGDDTESKEDEKWKFVRFTLIAKGVHESSMHEVMPGELFYIRLLLEKGFIGIGGEHGKMYVHIRDEGKDEIKIYHSWVRRNNRKLSVRIAEFMPAIVIISLVFSAIATILSIKAMLS